MSGTAHKYYQKSPVVASNPAQTPVSVSKSKHTVHHNGTRGSMYVPNATGVGGTMSAGRSSIPTTPGSNNTASASSNKRVSKPHTPLNKNTPGTPVNTASVAAYPARGISGSTSRTGSSSLFTTATGAGGRLVVTRLLGIDITLMVASYHTVSDLIALLMKKQKQYLHTNSLLHAHDIIAIINTNTSKILKTGAHRTNVDAFVSSSKRGSGWGFNEHAGLQHKAGKVGEQCSIGEVLWAVTKNEWTLFHNWMVEQVRMRVQNVRCVECLCLLVCVECQVLYTINHGSSFCTRTCSVANPPPTHTQLCT